MLDLTQGAEMTGAVTDLITALATLPILFFLRKFDRKKDRGIALWRLLFALIGLTSLIGFVVHSVVWSVTVKRLIWVFLYAIIYLLARTFFLLCHACRESSPLPSRPVGRILDISMALAYLATVILLFTEINPIRIMVIYCIFPVVAGFVIVGIEAIREHRRYAVIMLSAVLPQLIGGVYQVTRSGAFTLVFTFDHNSIYHICLLFSVIIFYFAAKSYGKMKNA